jgi:hypothetical protein
VIKIKIEKKGKGMKDRDFFLEDIWFMKCGVQGRRQANES